MKLGGDPMAAIIKAAKAEINMFYDAQFPARATRAYMYKRKAENAKAIVEGDQDIHPSIQAEAKMKGLQPIELARMIIDKNASTSLDTLDLLELERQERLTAVENAKSPEEVQTILKGEDHVHK